MEDDVFADEEEVTFYLVVEFVNHVSATHIVWAWFGPLPAHLACMHNFWYEVQDFVWDSYPVQEFSHSVV